VNMTRAAAPTRFRLLNIRYTECSARERDLGDRPRYGVRCGELDGQSPRFSILVNVEASLVDGCRCSSGQTQGRSHVHTTAMFTPRSEARNISSSRVESPGHQIELTV
jgi:hypothetical protein